MALEENYYPNLAAYFSGNLPDDDRKRVDAWRKENDRNEQMFQDALAIWNNSSLKLKHPKPDVEGDWHLLQQKIQSSEPRVVPIQTSFSWLKIAASLLILAVASVLLYRVTRPEKILLTSDSSVIRVYLPDSTEVWLNTGSSLTYTSDYGKNERNVELSGEGYFSVRRDTLKPFEISTHTSLTRVLGTKFNLKEEGENVTLHVAEGKVSFGNREKNSDTVIVTQHEAALLRAKSAPEKRKTTDRTFASWREQNNPVFLKERESPSSYLNTQYTWRKNKINQSVVEGTLRSTSSLATYSNIVMKVHYTRASGKVQTTQFVISETIQPGQELIFNKRLLDIFSDTKKIVIEVEKAEASIR